MLTCLNQYRAAVAEWSKAVLCLKIATNSVQSTFRAELWETFRVEFGPRMGSYIRVKSDESQKGWLVEILILYFFRAVAIDGQTDFKFYLKKV